MCVLSGLAGAEAPRPYICRWACAERRSQAVDASGANAVEWSPGRVLHSMHHSAFAPLIACTNLDYMIPCPYGKPASPTTPLTSSTHCFTSGRSSLPQSSAHPTGLMRV